MQKKAKKAFTLIEVIIATGILSITVFGIYKMIGENLKIINNSNNQTKKEFLIQNIKECIKYGQKEIISYTGGYLNLQDCKTSVTTQENVINNINYLIKLEKTSGNFTNTWKIITESDYSGKEEKIYIQKK